MTAAEKSAYQRRYYLDNRAKLNAYQKDFRASQRLDPKRRESENARDRERHALDPTVTRAAVKAWKQAHPEAVKLQKQRRRALQLGATVEPVTARQLRDLFEAFRNLCAYCAVRPATDVDHFMPLARGGAHALANLVPACGDCNRRKCARDPFDFIHDTAERPED